MKIENKNTNMSALYELRFGDAFTIDDGRFYIKLDEGDRGNCLACDLSTGIIARVAPDRKVRTVNAKVVIE